MFFCKECGNETKKWMGKCPVCGQWDSLKESKFEKTKKSSKKHSLITFKNEKPIKLNEIKANKIKRFSTDFSELDGVLGGGITPGMIALIGGEPGIGKSTLLLQISDNLAKKGKKILYVSGEESQDQIKLRGKRLNVDSENIILFCTSDAEEILKVIQQIKPDFIIVDSIQSVYFSDIDSYAGSIKQLREVTNSLTTIGKKLNIPIFLIGHITKSGIVAGPKIIEHMVDTVLYFESESKQHYKILRTSKNRFGSTNEIGIFKMETNGLHEIKNPSQLFILQDDHIIGKTIGAILEGSRTFFVEVQALVTPSNYGNPQRVAIGFDQKRLALLLAIIEKSLGISLGQYDVFLNLAGGIKVTDPALDLAIITSIISNFQERPISGKTLLIGEVGLNGEIRSVQKFQKRINEATKLGYDQIYLSKNSKNIRKSENLCLVKHLSEIYPSIYHKRQESELS